MSDEFGGYTPVEDPPPQSADVPLSAEPETSPAPAVEDDDQVLEIPTGEKLVPLSALTGSREVLKATKAELESLKPMAERARALEAEKAQLEAQLNQAMPLAQAYQAALAASQQAHVEPAEPQIPDTEAEKWAKRYDLYAPDGSGRYDLARGREIAADMRNTAREEATKAAREAVAPIQQQTVRDQSSLMLQRALITRGADGAAPDPTVLQMVWNSVDPSISSTPQGAAQLWAVALGYTAASGRGRPAAPASKADLPPPLVTERAGGRDTPITLNDGDKRVARDLGMSEKEYAETVAKMPWRAS